MSGPAQAGTGGDDSFRNIVLETLQGFPGGVPTGIREASQTMDARAQQVPASKKTWNKTFVASGPGGQVDCVFIAEDPSGQDDNMDINTKRIIDVTDRDP